jgi:hypothetical protein
MNHLKKIEEEPKEPKKTPLDGMTLDEKVAYLKAMIDQRKYANESDRDFL